MGTSYPAWATRIRAIGAKPKACGLTPTTGYPYGRVVAPRTQKGHRTDAVRSNAIPTRQRRENRLSVVLLPLFPYRDDCDKTTETHSPNAGSASPPQQNARSSPETTTSKREAIPVMTPDRSYDATPPRPTTTPDRTTPRQSSRRSNAIAAVRSLKSANTPNAPKPGAHEEEPSGSA